MTVAAHQDILPSLLEAYTCSLGVHAMVLAREQYNQPHKMVALHQNVLNTHLAAAYVKSSLDPDPPEIDPEQYGWYSPEADFMISFFQSLTRKELSCPLQPCYN